MGCQEDACGKEKQYLSDLLNEVLQIVCNAVEAELPCVTETPSNIAPVQNPGKKS